MSEPIRLYRNGETIETTSPSVARAWKAQGWSLTPDMMPNAAPEDELPALPEVENEEPFPWEVTPEQPTHWAADMINFVEPEPVQRKPGRPKKAQ